MAVVALVETVAVVVDVVEIVAAVAVVVDEATLASFADNLAIGQTEI